MKTSLSNIIKYIIGVVLFLGATSIPLYAQNDVSPKINPGRISGSTRTLISVLEKESGWTISYSNRMCMESNIRLKDENKSLIEHLQDVFARCPFFYVIKDNKVVIRPLNASEYSYTVSGFIYDDLTSETLPSANIYNRGNGAGTVSNNFGYYSLTLPAGYNEISASYVGFTGKTKSFELGSDTVINFRLSASIMLRQIDVKGEIPGENISTTNMGAIIIPADEIRQSPALLGETDLVKNIQMLPGVQGGSEGFSGLYVRGGGPDQNLILLDDVPVYNIGHLLGFFSIFNADAVKHVSVHKGSFPARYGGRLSSVVDIRMLEGNKDKVKGNLNLGLLSSGAALDGPVIKDKSSFALSFRRTYLDLIAGLVQRGNDARTNYYFYDLNAKYNHALNDRNKLYLNVYWGRDKYMTSYNFQTVMGDTGSPANQTSINDENNAGWGNFVGGLRWNFLITPKLFSNLTATYSDYRFFIGVQRSKLEENRWDSFEQRYLSGIRDFGARIDFDYFPSNNHIVKFGTGAIGHYFNPGIDIIQRDESSEQIDTSIGEDDLKGGEFHFYLEDEWSIREKFRANTGIRAVAFTGENRVYYSIEPRISISYRLNPSLSFRASYSEMSQFIHLVSSSYVNLPTDLWLPVTDRIAPMKSKQFNIGSDIYLDSKRVFQINTDVYYKELDNLLHYKESTGFFDYSTYWEEKLTTGSGESYGFEILLRKTRGVLSGWMGYTLAKTKNRFEGLNNGKSFPARFDRRHDFNISLSYRFNERSDMGLMWHYGSGTPVTLPSEKYYAPDFPYNKGVLNGGFSENAMTINDFRMPDFHRLDIGFNFTKEREKSTRIWSVGAINLYGRQNPFLLYFASESDDEPGSSVRTLKQLSLFPFPIPYLKYTLKF